MGSTRFGAEYRDRSDRSDAEKRPAICPKGSLPSTGCCRAASPTRSPAATSRPTPAIGWCLWAAGQRSGALCAARARRGRIRRRQRPCASSVATSGREFKRSSTRSHRARGPAGERARRRALRLPGSRRRGPRGLPLRPLSLEQERRQAEGQGQAAVHRRVASTSSTCGRPARSPPSAAGSARRSRSRAARGWPGICRTSRRTCSSPRSLAREARRMAREVGLTCRVLDVPEMTRLGMGAMLAVGQGSAHPPRMIILEHRPRGRTQIPARQDPRPSPSSARASPSTRAASPSRPRPACRT